MPLEVIKFHVVEGNCGSLLSYQSAKSSHIINIINATTCNLKYTNLFIGLGTLKGAPIKLHINNNITLLCRDIEDYLSML